MIQVLCLTWAITFINNDSTVLYNDYNYFFIFQFKLYNHSVNSLVNNRISKTFKGILLQKLIDYAFIIGN